jgi:heme A synthase
MGWWDYISFEMFLNVKNAKILTQIVLVKSYLVIVFGSIVKNVVRGTLTY